MKRPSKRAVLVGCGFFVPGFTIAIALTASFSVWLIRQTGRGVQANIVGGLSQSNGQLKLLDQSPDKLVPTILWTARMNTSIAAAMFSRMSKHYQPMVLFEFQRMNQSAILRSQRSPESVTARLARVMVLCSHVSAQPNTVHVGKSELLMMPLPEWVLNPNAAPITPVADQRRGMPYTPDALAAEFKKWTRVHDWVKANQSCIAKQGGVP